MDSIVFVQNIKNACKDRGLYPTVVCRESKVGASFINDIERGKTPSVAKVQQLAEYLGMTTSQLLGEVEYERKQISLESDTKIIDQDEEILLENFRGLNSEGKEKLIGYSDDLAQSGKYKKFNSHKMADKQA